MKENAGKLIGIGIASAAVIAAGAFFAARAKRPEPVVKDVYALDTFCAITVYEADGDMAEAADLAARTLKTYDEMFDAEDENSDIGRIDHREADRVDVSRDTAEMLSRAAELSEETGGALWPGIRPLTELWDIKNRTAAPSEDEIREALEKSRNASWRIEGTTFIAGNADTKIEAGAFAKGYIADRIREELVSAGVTSAIIDLGGNIQTIGKNPDGTPFRIGVKDPTGKAEAAAVIEADDVSVVTAGTYERYFEADGVRYHHILDPGTGYPARSGLQSVTISGPSSFVCDALATATLVLGKEKGMQMIENYNMAHHTAYEAYFIEE